MYVGDLDDESFQWEECDGIGNLPGRKSPMFPLAQYGYFFSDFFKWLKLTGYEYKQTDWGGWVAKVTKKQIFEFILYRYKTDPIYTDPKRMVYRDGKVLHVDQLKELIDYVKSLEDDKLYALVAAEL